MAKDFSRFINFPHRPCGPDGLRNEPGVNAVLLTYLAGMEGGLAAADILCGDVNPSGQPDIDNRLLRRAGTAAVAANSMQRRAVLPRQWSMVADHAG